MNEQKMHWFILDGSNAIDIGQVCSVEKWTDSRSTAVPIHLIRFNFKNRDSYDRKFDTKELRDEAFSRLMLSLDVK